MGLVGAPCPAAAAQLCVGHFSMRSRGLFVLLAGLVLLACIWLFHSVKSAPATADLSVVFLGLTNDPGESVYPRLSVVGDGRGLHALMAVTNVSQRQYLQFGISAVETQEGGGWRSQASTDFASARFGSALGSMWSPGFGALYAVPWPAGLATDTPWRLRLWVEREPKAIAALVNDLLKRTLFRPHGRHTVTSSVVTPLRLLAGEPEAHSRNAQPDGARAEINPGLENRGDSP